MKDADYLMRELRARQIAIEIERAVRYRCSALDIDIEALDGSILLAIAERQAALGVRVYIRKG